MTQVGRSVTTWWNVRRCCQPRLTPHLHLGNEPLGFLEPCRYGQGSHDQWAKILSTPVGVHGGGNATARRTSPRSEVGNMNERPPPLPPSTSSAFKTPFQLELFSPSPASHQRAPQSHYTLRGGPFEGVNLIFKAQRLSRSGKRKCHVFDEGNSDKDRQHVVSTLFQ